MQKFLFIVWFITGVVTGLICSLYIINETSPFRNFSIYIFLWATFVSLLLLVHYKKNIFLLLLSCFIIALTVECVFALLPLELERRKLFTIEKSEDYLRFYPEIGVNNIPNTSAIVSRYLMNDEAIFENIRYSIDHKGRRHTPLKTIPPGQDEHIMFFGGSFTFGMGVSDEETLPARLQQLAPQYRVLNYGMEGAGPVEMNSTLQNATLFNDVSQQSGVGIYVHIYDHLSRCAPFRLDRVKTMAWAWRFYRLDEADALMGPYKLEEMEDYIHYEKRIALLRESSPLFRYASVNYPLEYVSEKEAFTVCIALIQKAADEYRKHFEGPFVVLIWPTMPMSQGYRDFEDTLRDRGIHVFRPKFPKLDAPHTLHFRDAHPSPAMYAAVAQQLHGYIENEVKANLTSTN